MTLEIPSPLGQEAEAKNIGDTYLAISRDFVRLNDPKIWHGAYAARGIPASDGYIEEIAGQNRVTVEELAHVTAAGLRFGRDLLSGYTHQKENPHIRVVVLEAVQSFSGPAKTAAEMQQRAITVFGNREQPGTLAASLENHPSLLQEQKLFLDVVRAYGASLEAAQKKGDNQE